jgi:hypothetical protein
MAEDPVAAEADKNETSSNNDCWRVYEILVAEMRHLHSVWIDNFRVLLTFNSILLPGAFAVLALAQRGTPGNSTASHHLSTILVLVLSCVGIMTTIVMLLIIRRIKAYTVLRQAQARRAEVRLSDRLPVSPFIEGFVLGGGKEVLCVSPAKDAVRPMRLSWFNSAHGYVLIGVGFIIAYLLLGAVSFLS